MSVFPDGLYQYGGQPVGAMWASPWSTARFVDAATGNDGFDGLKPTQAFKTIQAAVTASGRGDVIYVRPQTYTVGTGFARYTEMVTVPLATSDLSIIGTVNSINPEYGVRWKHATDTSGYNLINDGPALHLENIGFFSEGAADTALLRNSDTTNSEKYGANGTTFYNCVVKGARISIQCGDGVTIRNCMFHGSNGVTGGIIAVPGVNPGRRLRIRDCVFQEGNAAAVDTTYISVTTFSEVLIDSCRFGLRPTDTKFITTVTSTGLISNCYFQDASATADITLSTGMIMVGCYDVLGGLPLPAES